MKDYIKFQGLIDLLFTDIDDTLTSEGRLPSSSYSMLWELHRSGIAVVPVTGRPAGWCEMIARTWPVVAVIGENGAFYFKYEGGQMKRVFALGEEQRQENQKKLQSVQNEIFEKIPQASLASDQFCRLFDVAIDICEDVQPLTLDQIEKIQAIFKRHGAQCKISSIHINGWFGSYDKQTMCELYCQKELVPLGDLSQVAFVGDSPNDEVLFSFFKNSFGVGNVRDFTQKMKHLPQFVTPSARAQGFVELGSHLIKIRN